MMSRKFILLDIDGVMVPASNWKPVELHEDGFYKFNFLAQKHLDCLLEKTGATIILTTTHRTRFTNAEWKKLFDNRFKNAGEIQTLDDFALELDKKIRRDEVLAWITKYAGDSQYVIIDDDSSLHDLPPQVKRHLVRTQSMIGFNEDAMAEALKILNE